MSRWLVAGLALGLGGCGLAIPVLRELAPPPEGFLVRQAGRQLPLELRFVGDPGNWARTASGGISVRSGSSLAVRVPGLTMFRAVLQVRSSGGYRMLVRTTPQEWMRQRRASVSLTVLPERVILQTAAGSDTLDFPGAGSYRWELLQLESGCWLRLECLPRMWLPAPEPLTEWILLEPLPGSSVTLEAITIEEALPFVVEQQTQ